MKTIEFSEITKKFECCDANTLVITGLIATDEDKKDIEDFFNAEGLFPEGGEVINLYKIGGNVKGDEGRTDILIEHNAPKVNVYVRLAMAERIGLKWTSDFIDNYGQDYGVMPDYDDYEDEYYYDCEEPDDEYEDE